MPPTTALLATALSALLVPAMPLAGEAAQNSGRLRGVGDRFLNGSGVGDPVPRQEPVPLSATQIPGFFGAGDPLRAGTIPEPWDLDPLTAKDPKAGLALPADLGKAAPLPPQAGLKQAGTADLLDVEGQLEDGDEVLQDGRLYDLYTFDGEAGPFIEIRLNSDDFDAYLILLGPDGERVAEDDNGGEGLNSLIQIQLPQTGHYLVIVIANAYDPGGRGRYRLTAAAISAEAYQRGQENARARVEADQLLQQGIQQFNRSQFREALASWE
ncbi:PPC domain-containing protein [Leptolyngbya sp. PCC 6406]|uniref:PPC domain-containing protein n=1 Tax=Leptolyngbya sp. PCC 6406 TaxID=1173264 RepID=UPI0002AC6488|nr:PPC domain-containing protein [Leptolyngbya sp. PCC 6406]